MSNFATLRGGPFLLCIRAGIILGRLLLLLLLLLLLHVLQFLVNGVDKG